MFWAHKWHIRAKALSDSGDFFGICANYDFIKKLGLQGGANRIGDDRFPAKWLDIFVWDSFASATRWDKGDFFHLFLPFCDSLEDLINPPNLKIHTFYES